MGKAKTVWRLGHSPAMHPARTPQGGTLPGVLLGKRAGVRLFMRSAPHGKPAALAGCLPGTLVARKTQHGEKREKKNNNSTDTTWFTGLSFSPCVSLRLNFSCRREPAS
ncbi:uncharacterized protein Tco025E_06415 [Trypanosoma conorhini]|uniref:Uncharacterized protein n=1 Tax=Trypanosoma conorhini TaxID=83891 RepID=A0A422P4Q8_9TRYP|nr:uncharacterized protein Tco025E_06415 [Trypanosoma conorhini]RNF12703.1 hypothetical protein Tco025E_06415 [Trypanosoma conorhini]